VVKKQAIAACGQMFCFFTDLVCSGYEPDPILQYFFSIAQLKQQTPDIKGVCVFKLGRDSGYYQRECQSMVEEAVFPAREIQRNYAFVGMNFGNYVLHQEKMCLW
jgi:hypothetical protein